MMVPGTGVVIINDILTSAELSAFRKECDGLYDTMSTNQLALCSCAIDLFESSDIADDSPARLSSSSYFEERWRNSCFITAEERSAIENVIKAKLPRLLARVINARQLFLFNEHYVVKPPSSDLTFRWHTDFDEQLQCLESPPCTPYYSMWCPLDDTCQVNGTLVVPVDCSIVHMHLSYMPLPPSPPPTSAAPPPALAPPAPGRALLVPAGSVVIFPSDLLHCSGPNRSPHARRVFYAQYSQQVITSGGAVPLDKQAPLCFAVPWTPRPVDGEDMSQCLSVCPAEDELSVVVSTSSFDTDPDILVTDTDTLETETGGGVEDGPLARDCDIRKNNKRKGGDS